MIEPLATRKKKPRNRAGPVRYGLTWAPPGGSAHTEMLSRASSLVYACPRSMMLRSAPAMFATNTEWTSVSRKS